MERYLSIILLSCIFYSCDPKIANCSYGLTKVIINKTNDTIICETEAINYYQPTFEQDTLIKYINKAFMKGFNKVQFSFFRQDNNITYSPYWAYPIIYTNQDRFYNLSDTSKYIINLFPNRDSSVQYHDAFASFADSLSIYNGGPVYYFEEHGAKENRKGIETIIIDDEFVKAFMKKDYTMLETFKDYYK